MARSKRHLEQMEREKAPNPFIDRLEQNYGVNEDTQLLLKGKLVTEGEVSPKLAAWAEVMTQSEHERTRAPVVGIIPKDKYQEMFKAATEKTSSNSTEGMD